jgi:hypothetical protein
MGGLVRCSSSPQDLNFDCPQSKSVACGKKCRTLNLSGKPSSHRFSAHPLPHLLASTVNIRPTCSLSLSTMSSQSTPASQTTSTSAVTTSRITNSAISNLRHLYEKLVAGDVKGDDQYEEWGRGWVKNLVRRLIIARSPILNHYTESC